MENTTYIALSRQMALWRQMDVVANNMANTNTPGFKRERMMFEDYLLPAGDGGRADELAFVQDRAVYRDLAAGPLKRTDNPLDVALNGDGYFVVETPEGMRYTRAGRFHLDETGMLLNSSGHPVMQPGDIPIVFAPNEADINIGRDGTISTENGIIGRLRVVRFDNEQELRKAGGGLYASEQMPVEIARPDVVQGMLEQSNVNPVEETTQMIEVLRSYQFVQKVLEQEHERRGKAIEVLSGARS